MYRAGLDAGLDRVALLLLRSIREAQSELAAMSSPMPQETVYGESLDRFLARLPRHWRTREDPFEGVWCDVLLWLQKDPDTTAKDLLAILAARPRNRIGEPLGV